MHYLLLLLFAVVAGFILPVQAGLNTELGRTLKSPVYATLVSFATGLIALLAYGLLTRMPFRNLRDAFSLPWYYWTGGVIGAVYVYAIIILAPRLGVALTFGVAVASQMALSIAMDHYGWLGVPVHPVNWYRVLGVALAIGGVILVRAN